MSREAARKYAQKNLQTGEYLIGWKPGSCRPVFQFWVPQKGTASELAPGSEPPSGRRAAIEWTKNKWAS